MGTLNTIALPNGYTQTMNYTSSVLTSVSDSYSRTLSFSYTSGKLTGVSTPDSATLTYRLHDDGAPEPANLDHLQHKPLDQPDVCLRQHQLPVRVNRDHRRKRQQLCQLDV